MLLDSVMCNSFILSQSHSLISRHWHLIFLFGFTVLLLFCSLIQKILNYFFLLLPSSVKCCFQAGDVINGRQGLYWVKPEAIGFSELLKQKLCGWSLLSVRPSNLRLRVCVFVFVCVSFWITLCKCSNRTINQSLSCCNSSAFNLINSSTLCDTLIKWMH